MAAVGIRFPLNFGDYNRIYPLPIDEKVVNMVSRRYQCRFVDVFIKEKCFYDHMSIGLTKFTKSFSISVL